MKYLALFSLYFFYFNLSAQNNYDSIKRAFQKQKFEKAEIELNKNNNLLVLNYYHSICFLRDLHSIDFNEYEIIAKKRIDSLLPFFQNEEVKKWRGKWKLKKLTNNDYNYEFIEIKETKLLFYAKNLSSPIREEHIQFAPYDSSNLSISYSSLLFENNEIWEFTVKETENEKRLVTEVKRMSDGTYISLLDERGIIIDPVQREKAYEEEIRTYYILEK